MDDTWKDNWMAALRSRSYRQTRGALCVRDANGDEAFCCLGVLADLNGAKWSPAGDRGRFMTQRNEATLLHLFDDASYLPSAALAWLDTPVYAGHPTPTNHQDVLTEMNDDDISFDAIADWIEAH